MPLPTVDDLREYLRIETHVEDAMLERLLAQARASVEAYIRSPIEAREQTFTVTAERVAYAGSGIYGMYAFAGGGTRLVLPFAPIGGTVVVTDDDGTEVDFGDFTVGTATGRITAASGVTFDSRPYTVTATVGLSLRPDYEVAVLPALSSAILDWAADLYQRRNPAASYESGGGGVAVNYNETASKTMPSRIRVTLDPWRRVLV